MDIYRQHFDTTELNFTYYRMPSAGMLEKIGAKVGPDFRFSVKVPGEITHDREDDPRPAIAQFDAALAPLKDAGKFACALAQFPFCFHATQANEDYLKIMAEGFNDTPVAVEFRNRNWVTEDTFDLLHDYGLGFCCVDQPEYESLLPPIAIATSPVAYVRFHGRNYQKWWQPDAAWERYDYMYTAEELGEWVLRLAALDAQPETRVTLVYMNNYFQGQAPASARLLQGLLHQAGANLSQKAGA